MYYDVYNDCLASIQCSSVPFGSVLFQFWLDTSGYLSSSMLFQIANVVLTVEPSAPPAVEMVSLTNLIGVSIFRQRMNGSSDSQRMLFLSPASQPPTLFVEDILFTLYVAPPFALPARPPSSPTSADRSASEQSSRSSPQPASFLCCFTSGPVVLGPYRTIFSWNQLPKTCLLCVLLVITEAPRNRCFLLCQVFWLQR